MSFIGDDSVLIYIDGGIANIEENVFRYVGYLSDKELSESLDNIKLSYKKVYMPYDDYTMDILQMYGCLWFDFNLFDLPKGYAHSIKNNVFESIFSKFGASVGITGTQIQ